MITKTDCELIKAYVTGEELALEVLLGKYKVKVFNYIYNRVNNFEVAEDLFQDVFVKVIITLKEGKYREEGKFIPWVLRIAHNLIIDYLRVSGNNKVIGSEIYYDGDECFTIFDKIRDSEKTIEEILVQKQIEADLNNLLVLLPEDQQEILRLRFYKNMSFKEIADEINVSINTALGRLRYALVNLRKLISKKQLEMHYH